MVLIRIPTEKVDRADTLDDKPTAWSSIQRFTSTTWKEGGTECVCVCMCVCVCVRERERERD